MKHEWEEGIEYARYTSDDYSNIEVLYIIEDKDHPQGRVAKTWVLPADENSDQFKKLLEYYSADQLLEMTYIYNKNARESYEKEVMSIARQDGILNKALDIASSNVVDDVVVDKIIDLVFLENLPEDELKELIFKTKLKLFEVNMVKSSKNRSLKSKLRKAKTLKEVLYNMVLIQEDIAKKTT